MEMNLLNPKEVFVGKIPLHKNLSRVLHNYHSLRDLNLSLRPMFLRFHNKYFSVLVSNFGRGYITTEDEFVETKRGFCWEHSPSQKPLSVFTRLSHFKKFKFIFEAYCFEILQ
jgi:hypothetical protein